MAAFDVLSQTSLNGCLKSAAPEAPTDLATNSDQMEGLEVSDRAVVDTGPLVAIVRAGRSPRP